MPIITGALQPDNYIDSSEQVVAVTYNTGVLWPVVSCVTPWFVPSQLLNGAFMFTSKGDSDSGLCSRKKLGL